MIRGLLQTGKVLPTFEVACVTNVEGGQDNSAPLLSRYWLIRKPRLAKPMTLSHEVDASLNLRRFSVLDLNLASR